MVDVIAILVNFLVIFLVIYSVIWGLRRNVELPKNGDEDSPEE